MNLIGGSTGKQKRGCRAVHSFLVAVPLELAWWQRRLKLFGESVYKQRFGGSTAHNLFGGSADQINQVPQLPGTRIQ